MVNYLKQYAKVKKTISSYEIVKRKEEGNFTKEIKSEQSLGGQGKKEKQIIEPSKAVTTAQDKKIKKDSAERKVPELKTKFLSTQKAKKILEKRVGSVSTQKLQKKAPSTKEDSRIVTIPSQEGFPLLREKEILKNLLMKAEEERSKGNYYEAKNFYEAYLKKISDPYVYNNYGSLLYFLGDYRGAEKAFEKAFVSQRNPTVILNLIIVKLKLNKMEEACQFYQNYAEALKNFSEAESIKKICNHRIF